MTNIDDEIKHTNRRQLLTRMYLVCLAAAEIALVAFGIVIQSHVQSAVLGGIGVAALVVVIVTGVWARILRIRLVLTRPTRRKLK